MPRKMVTPNMLELTHADCPGVKVTAYKRPSAALDVGAPLVDVTGLGAKTMTSREARMLAAMIGEAADFADGLD